MKHADRITFDPEQCGGGLAFAIIAFASKTSWICWLRVSANSKSLKDYSFLESDDICACLEFAFEQVNYPVLATA